MYRYTITGNENQAKLERKKNKQIRSIDSKLIRPSARTHAQIDGQPENIMPPAAHGMGCGGIRIHVVVNLVTCCYGITFRTGLGCRPCRARRHNCMHSREIEPFIIIA